MKNSLPLYYNYLNTTKVVVNDEFRNKKFLRIRSGMGYSATKTISYSFYKKISRLL